MTSITTDPIADMLARIRNAIAVHKTEVTMPHSNIKEAVAQLLKTNGFIDDVSVDKAPVGKILHITLHSPQQNARITKIVRLSRPGRRHYARVTDIPKVKQGRGTVILSTSQGVMTGDQAISKRIGGELLCEVY